MNFRYLTAGDIAEIAQAAAKAQLIAPQVREIILLALNQGFALSLNAVGNPILQVNGDLGLMNVIERLDDGSVPLLDWLQQAGTLARQMSRPQADVFTKYETKVNGMATGQHPFPNPTTIREIEKKEDIVHRDDMVDFAFLAAGTAAGASVVKIFVARYENRAPVMNNGKPVRHLGTGWLITKDLLVTNHHVVNARMQGQPHASKDDLLLQGSGTMAKFDYDSVDMEGEDISTARLEAWDIDLDYALLRLQNPSTRSPLRLYKTPIVFSDGIYVPVNIIQHPSGNPKRVAFRNNLLTGADNQSVRYFTDTLSGSSGSPVFKDDWSVIALHRASEQVTNVSFQGKEVAVVNVGTQITSILAHLSANHPALYAEIA